MAGEPTAGVRATLAGLAAEAAAVAARALPVGVAASGVAAACARLLVTLVRDGTPSVSKRAAGGAAGAVGDVARTAAGTADGAPSRAGGTDPAPALAAAVDAWAAADALNAALLAIVRGEGEPGAGARAAAIKAAEGAALSLDALSQAVRRGGGGQATPTAADAARAAGESGAALAGLLKGAAGLPGTVAIAAVKAASAMAGGGAPALAGRVLPALTGLATADAQAGAAGASTRAALKTALLSLYRSPSASLGAWRAKVGAALVALGAGEAVDPADAAAAASCAATRPAEGEPDGMPAAKRHRTDSGDGAGAGATPAPADPRRRVTFAANLESGPAAPPPPPSGSTAAAPLPLPSPGSWTAPPGLHPEIRTALARAAHLAALDGSPLAPAVAVFIASLPPALVADAVLECVRTLPAGAVPGPAGPGGLHSLGAELMAAALRPPAALVAAAAAAAGGPPRPPPRGRWDAPPPGGRGACPPPPLAAPSPGADFGVYADLVVKALADKAAKAAGGGAKKEEVGEDGTKPEPETPGMPITTITLPLPPPPGPAPPAFPLVAVDMDARARREARRGAFGRLIGRGGGGEAAAFRAAALARLAAGEAPGEGLGDALLAHLASAPAGDGGDQPLALAATAVGVDLALAWLTSLAVAEVEVGSGAGADASASLPSPTGRYAAALTSVLATVRVAVEGAGGDPGRALEAALLGAPHLPAGTVRAFLADAIAAGGATATAAMTAAHALAVGRPPVAGEALGAVLHAAVDPDGPEGVRSKAVRLAANRLVREAALAGAVVAAAEKGLWAVTKDWVAEEKGEDEAEEEAGGGGDGGGEEEAAEAEAEPAPAAEAELAPAAAPPTSSPQTAPSVELYCALVTRRPDLLPGLLAAFGAAPPRAPGRAAIMRLADGLARVLGPGSPALVGAVEDGSPPPGCAPLLLKLLYVATEASPASASLATALLARHAASPDPRLLPPALGGLPRGAALGLLPQLLALGDVPLRAALHRLLMVVVPGAAAAGAPPSRHVPPAELLSAIMTTDPASIPGPGLGLERLKAAVAACLAQPAIFDVAALSACLTHLAKRGTAELRPPPGVPPAPLPLSTTTLPLPPLFMRLLVQALAAAPALRPLAVALLATTAGRRPALWEAEPAQWKGWLLAARAAAPDSFAVAVALPGPVLAAALRDSDAGAALRAPVTDYARSSSCPVRVAPDVLAALDEVEAEARAARAAAV